MHHKQDTNPFTGFQRAGLRPVHRHFMVPTEQKSGQYNHATSPASLDYFMFFFDIPLYSKRPKTERSDFSACRNPNFFVFGFQTVRISDVQD